MQCTQAKSCLQAALRSSEGLKLQEEKLDRAYECGLIGKVERWSKKKLIRQQIDVNLRRNSLTIYGRAMLCMGQSLVLAVNESEKHI